MKYCFFLLLLTTFWANCSMRRAYQTDLKEPITESLFNDKDRTLSESDIQKLLTGRLVLPETLRLAVFKFGMNNRFYNRYNYLSDENLVKAHQSYLDTLMAGLKNNNRVESVHPVPSLMLSANPTITQLRETSVRLQSDVLLVYSTTSDIYYKYKAFKKNETKAFATTEVFLMDIRTGLVPFTTVVTKDFYTKTLHDETVDETRKRAEQEAVILTLGEVGKQVDVFLKNFK